MADKLLSALDAFTYIRDKSGKLEELHSTRNATIDAIEKMFMMDWTSPTDPELKGLVTVSPGARNAAIGAVRLLTAADPVFSVPYDKTDKAAHKAADNVEKWCNALWYQNGRVRGKPLHYSAVLSAVLTDEIYLAVSSTADMLASADRKNKAIYNRIERIAATVPYVIEVMDTRTGFPEYDALGLSSFFRKVDIKSGEILDKYGERAVASGINPLNRFDDVTLCEYWDSQLHAVWIDGKGDPIICTEHGDPCLRVVAARGGDSTLFSEDSYQSQPFLYTLYKSGMWERQNLALTVMAASIFRYGAYPTYVTQNEGIDVDYSKLGGVVFDSTNTLRMLDKKPIDQALWQFSDMLKSSEAESTLYRQTLGEPLGSNAPYSMVSLLNQAGRLPLVPIQRLGQAAFGAVMDVCLTLLKDGGKMSRVSNKSGDVMALKPGDVEAGMIIDCKLDIDLPQDDRQNAQMVTQLAGLGFPMRWLAENFLHVGQWADMQQEAFDEKATTAMLDMTLHLL